MTRLQNLGQNGDLSGAIPQSLSPEDLCGMAAKMACSSPDTSMWKPTDTSCWQRLARQHRCMSDRDQARLCMATLCAVIETLYIMGTDTFPAWLWPAASVDYPWNM